MIEQFQDTGHRALCVTEITRYKLRHVLKYISVQSVRGTQGEKVENRNEKPPALVNLPIDAESNTQCFVFIFAHFKNIT